MFQQSRLTLRNRPFAGIALPAFCLLAGILGSALLDSIQSPPPSYPAQSQATALIVEPDPVSFGVLEAGHASRARIALRNLTSQPVVLTRLEMSCPCLRTRSLPARLEPHGSATLSLDYDPADDPAFHGRLSIIVIGRDEGDVLVFRSRANLDIRSRRPGPLLRADSGE